MHHSKHENATHGNQLKHHLNQKYIIYFASL